ncbi:TPA: DUF4400 domain-containing protein [Klebsiella quasipneumoniae subsp. similipneumoniae]
MSEQRSPPTRPAQGPIGWLLSLAGRLIGLVIGALVLRIVLELAGLYFWWPQEGNRHVFQVMEKDYKMIMHIIASHLFFDKIQIMLNHAVMYVTKNNPLNTCANEIINNIFITTLSCYERIVILILTLPLTFLFLIIGIIDGLAQLDIRRFCADNDSTVRYNIMCTINKITHRHIPLLLIAYPFNISLNLIYPTMAIISGFIISQTIQQYKKYV